MKNLKNHIITYLKNIHTMQLATANNNLPWCCNVYFTFDESLNIYFISRPSRKHSEDIRSNAQVAVCFCKEHDQPFNMPNQGIQAAGFCQEIDQEHRDFSQLKDLYLKRFPDSEKMFESHFVYKIIPEKVILFDEVNYPEDPWQTFLL